MMSNNYSSDILRPHRMLEKNIDNQQIYAINFTDGDFTDIIFSYGKVEFIEDEENDKLITKFDYTVHEHKKKYNKKKFEKELGDFLIEMVMNGLMKNNLIYTGGTDEGRTDDYSSSNQQ